MSLTMSIDFAANIARLEENSRKAAGSVQKMSSDIDGAVSFAKGALLSLGAALGVNAFVSQVRGASEAADAAAKMSDRFGIATESAIGMGVAVAMAGGTQEGLGRALRQTTMAVGEASIKTGEMRDSFTRLGMSAAELARLPVDEQFTRIISKLGEMQNVTERNYLANKILGKSYTDVAGLVAEGGDAIRSATEDAKAWGLAATRVDVAKLEAANDAMARVANSSKGLYTTIAISLAPAIKTVADYFADSAREANGYRDEVAQGSEFVAQALAYSVNALHLLKEGWAGVKLTVGIVTDWVLQAIGSMDRAYIEFMNGLADTRIGQALGLERREMSHSFALMLDESEKNVERLRDEAFALVDAGWPAEKILAKWHQVQAQMQREAEATAAARQASGGSPGANITTEDPEAAKRELAWQQGVAMRLAKIQESNLTEVELENGKLLQIQNDLAAALQQRLISEADYRTQMEQEQLKHEAKLGDIMAQGTLARQKFVQMSARLQTQTVLGEMVNMTAGVATSNRTLFEINKMASTANAIINTYQGATLALANYPGPIGWGMAALTVATGLAQVAAINSAQFGSSTSAPSIGGGGATPITNADPGGASAGPLAVSAMPEIEKKKTQVSLTLVGSQFSYQQVAEQIIPLINEAADNGADIRVAYA